MESTKKKVGLFLPVALADALDVVASRVGKKQKWLIVGAALVRLLETREDEQNELIRRVKIADLPGGSFEKLITQAKNHAAGAPGFENLVAFDSTDDRPAGARKGAQKSSGRGAKTQAVKKCCVCGVPGFSQGSVFCRINPPFQ